MTERTAERRIVINGTGIAGVWMSTGGKLSRQEHMTFDGTFVEEVTATITLQARIEACWVVVDLGQHKADILIVGLMPGETEPREWRLRELPADAEKIIPATVLDLATAEFYDYVRLDPI